MADQRPGAGADQFPADEQSHQVVCDDQKFHRPDEHQQKRQETGKPLLRLMVRGEGEDRQRDDRNQNGDRRRQRRQRRLQDQDPAPLHPSGPIAPGREQGQDDQDEHRRGRDGGQAGPLPHARNGKRGADADRNEGERPQHQFFNVPRPSVISTCWRR